MRLVPTGGLSEMAQRPIGEETKCKGIPGTIISDKNGNATGILAQSVPTGVQTHGPETGWATAGPVHNRLFARASDRLYKY